MDLERLTLLFRSRFVHPSKMRWNHSIFFQKCTPIKDKMESFHILVKSVRTSCILCIG